MLVRFSVENFLSYDKKQTFSMIAGHTKNHPEHLYEIEKVNLLKLSAIYGANASGKSKMFEAMRFASHVIKSGIPFSAAGMFCKLTEENRISPSLFEFEFYIDGSFYAYGFSAVLSAKKLTAEWLYKLNPGEDKQEFIYEREFDCIEGSYGLNINRDVLSLSDEEEKLLDFLSGFMDDERVLFLNTINKSSKAIKSSSLRYFADAYKFFTANLEFIMPDTVIQSFEGFESLEDGEDSFKKFIEIINSFDTGIVDIRNEHLQIDELEKKLPAAAYQALITGLDEQRNNPAVESLSATYSGIGGWYRIEQNNDEDQLDVTTVTLRHKNSIYDFGFSDESDGTQKIFDLLRVIMQSRDGGVYIIDELERSLHPMVTQRLIELFIELTRGKRTQLIFTTHESSIMSQDIFRRDEIWFVEKSPENTSVIYSLDKFSERYDRKIDKAYLEGRYGAIPILTGMRYKDGDE